MGGRSRPPTKEADDDGLEDKVPSAGGGAVAFMPAYICGLPPQSVVEPLGPELRTMLMDSLLDLMCVVLVARLDRENQVNAMFDKRI